MRTVAGNFYDVDLEAEYELCIDDVPARLLVGAPHKLIPDSCLHFSLFVEVFNPDRLHASLSFPWLAAKVPENGAQAGLGYEGSTDPED